MHPSWNTPEGWLFQEVLMLGERQLHQQYHRKVHDSVSSIRSGNKQINYLHSLYSNIQYQEFVNPWQEGLYITWYELGTLKYLNIRTKTKRLSTERLCSNMYLKKRTKVKGWNTSTKFKKVKQCRGVEWCQSKHNQPFKLLFMGSKINIQYAITSNSRCLIWSISLWYTALRPYIEEKQKQNKRDEVGFIKTVMKASEILLQSPNDKNLEETLQNIDFDSSKTLVILAP